MKILIDENLSYRLSRQLQDLFPLMRHVRDLELKSRPDTDIWKFAKEESFDAILTADIDFQRRVLELGSPPKVIRIEKCDFSSSEIVQLLRREAIRIHHFLSSAHTLLILRR